MSRSTFLGGGGASSREGIAPTTQTQYLLGPFSALANGEPQHDCSLKHGIHGAIETIPARYWSGAVPRIVWSGAVPRIVVKPPYGFGCHVH